MTIEIDQIRKLLPQKPPFLMVDRVVYVDQGVRLIGLKNVTINDEILSVHFSSNPIMPGAFIIEAMAQMAILLHRSINNFEINEDWTYYLGSVKARFFKSVVPGDELRLEALMIKALPKGLCVEVKSYVQEEKVAESELICIVEK